MDKTPKSLRFVRNGNDDSNSVFPKSNITSTPVKQTKKPRIWDNDIFSPENSVIDVAWDWDSPKNIKPKALHRSKIEYEEIPKLPAKKNSQIDHIKNFEKLKEELQALRNEIARVDDDCLALSLDEQTFREESAKESDDLNSFIEQQYFHSESQETENLLNMDDNLLKIKHNTSADNLFDDSCEEQLLLCTQILEERLLQSNVENVKIVTCNQSQKKILKQQNQGNGAINSSSIHKAEVSATCTSYSTSDIKQDDRAIRTLELKNISSDNLLSTNTIVENSIIFNKTADDSFDAVLKDFEDEDIDTLTQMNNNNMKSFTPRKFQACSSLNTSFKRTFSDANVQYNPKNVESTKVNKFSFHRTHSFESAATKEGKILLPTDINI
ncbi:hypothetical protein WA026_013337 [Henosepilachna vigintioctopunctata]|uniref:Uncharacterized protein n=1 Tax=Henosepilachna vigintioctopunctata TaxID=420089 RepID=A0AAW1VFZ2_9CUCU